MKKYFTSFSNKKYVNYPKIKTQLMLKIKLKPDQQNCN